MQQHALHSAEQQPHMPCQTAQKLFQQCIPRLLTMWSCCTNAHLWRCPIGPSDFNGPETPFIARLDEEFNLLSFLEAPEALSFDCALQELEIQAGL